jgi:TRAP-type C4-dicarboxylate transport system permease small subunit
MEIYRKVLDQMDKVQSKLIYLFYVLIVVVVSFQVLNRFILKWPVVWTSDFAVICFVWLGFLCASQAVRKSGHFRMSVLLERNWKGDGRRVLELIALVVVLGLSAIMLLAGVTITMEGLNETSPGLNVSMAWAYLAVPFCSLTSLLFAFEKLIEEIHGRNIDSSTSLKELA